MEVSMDVDVLEGVAGVILALATLVQALKNKG
ncbi:hypothetical protein VCSRO54_3590 [Vibrio cholerae]|nr:hypothetical protein VCSRO54_3590 [Vibrio cholerae]